MYLVFDLPYGGTHQLSLRNPMTMGYTHKDWLNVLTYILGKINGS